MSARGWPMTPTCSPLRTLKRRCRPGNFKRIVGMYHSRYRSPMRSCLLLALLLLAASAAAADTVYKWTDQHGVVHYGDKPLDPGAKPAKLPALQGYSVLDSKKKGGGKK